MTPRIAGTLLVLLSAAAFAVIAVLGKRAFDYGATPEMLVAVRFALATLLFWVYLGARRRLRSVQPLRVLKLTAVGGLLYGSMSIFYFAALARIPASLTVMLLYAWPALVVALSPAFLGESITFRKVAALLLCLAGIAAIVGLPTQGTDAVGIVFGLLSAVSYALYLILGVRWLSGMDMLLGLAYLFLGTTVVVSLYAVARHGLQADLSAQALGLLLVIGVLSIVAVVSVFAGVRRIGAMRGAIVSTFEPVVTVTLAVSFLGERLGGIQVIGGVLVILAVVILQWPSRRREPVALPDEGSA